MQNQEKAREELRRELSRFRTLSGRPTFQGASARKLPKKGTAECLLALGSMFALMIGFGFAKNPMAHVFGMIAGGLLLVGILLIYFSLKLFGPGGFMTKQASERLVERFRSMDLNGLGSEELKQLADFYVFSGHLQEADLVSQHMLAQVEKSDSTSCD